MAPPLRPGAGPRAGPGAATGPGGRTMKRRNDVQGNIRSCTLFNAQSDREESFTDKSSLDVMGGLSRIVYHITH